GLLRHGDGLCGRGAPDQRLALHPRPDARVVRPAGLRMRLAQAVLFAAIAAGFTYIGSWFMPLPSAAAIAWKGAGVGLLALYAALNARSPDGWLLVGVMGFGALGDVLLETNGAVTGGGAFLVGHLVAVALYLRNRRPRLI